MIIVGGVAVALLCVFGNAGFRSLCSNVAERQHLLRSVDQLRADHDALSKEWQRIQTDKGYTEYLIRKNLGYVKKGEVEYRFKATDGKS